MPLNGWMTLVTLKLANSKRAGLRFRVETVQESQFPSTLVVESVDDSEVVTDTGVMTSAAARRLRDWLNGVLSA